MKSSQTKPNHHLPEILKPFGLILGHSGQKDVFGLIKNEKGKIIPGDLFDLHREPTHPNHTWVTGAGLKHFYFFKAVSFEFYKGRLFGLCCIFPSGHDSDSFEVILYNLEIQYYGVCKRYHNNDCLEETFAIWEYGDTTIELMFDWRKEELFLVYRSESSIQAILKENEKYFREMVLKTSGG